MAQKDLSMDQRRLLDSTMAMVELWMDMTPQMNSGDVAEAAERVHILSLFKARREAYPEERIGLLLETNR